MSYVGSIGDFGNKATFSGTLPTVATGDVIALFVSYASAYSTSITAGPSMTLVSTVVDGAYALDFYKGVLDSSDSATTVTATVSVSQKAAMGAIIMRGADTSDPFPSATWASSHAQDTSHDSPAVTVSETTDIITVVGDRGNGTTTSYTPPAGVTEVQDLCNTSSGTQSLAIGYVAGVTSGTYGVYSWTIGGTVTTVRHAGITIGVNATSASSTYAAAGTTAAVSATIGDASPTAPGAPTDASAVAGVLSATVTFRPPSSNGGAPIDHYTITSSPGGFTTTVYP